MSTPYSYRSLRARTSLIGLAFGGPYPHIRRFLSPYREPAPHRYHYPACALATDHPLSRLHGSGERPCIVILVVICHYGLKRALSPVLFSFFYFMQSGLNASFFFISVHAITRSFAASFILTLPPIPASRSLPFILLVK